MTRSACTIPAALHDARQFARSLTVGLILGLFAPHLALAQSAPRTSQAAPPAGSSQQAEPEEPATVQIAGVETLVDYAAVGRLLGTVEGVRRVDVTEANGTNVTFRVLVRGGRAALDRALEGSSQLARGTAADGRVFYQYRR